MKANRYGSFGYTLYFWRTKQGSEMDVVLVGKDGAPYGLEIKSTAKRPTVAFKNRYHGASSFALTRSNFF